MEFHTQLWRKCFFKFKINIGTDVSFRHMCRIWTCAAALHSRSCWFGKEILQSRQSGGYWSRPDSLLRGIVSIYLYWMLSKLLISACLGGCQGCAFKAEVGRGRGTVCQQLVYKTLTWHHTWTFCSFSVCRSWNHSKGSAPAEWRKKSTETGLKHCYVISLVCRCRRYSRMPAASFFAAQWRLDESTCYISVNARKIPTQTVCLELHNKKHSKMLLLGERCANWTCTLQGF